MMFSIGAAAAGTITPKAGTGGQIVPSGAITIPAKATITAKAGPGGRIVPSGAITVKEGTTQQFAIAPDSGYAILSVTGCDGKLGTTSDGSTYTTGRIKANCTVTASFKLRAPRISSFKINNDAAETTTQSVTLNFRTATGSMPTHYRASERPDFAGVAWKPLGGAPAAPIFDFGAGAGSKTVYLQLIDQNTYGGSNVSNVMSDTIKFPGRRIYEISGRDFRAAAELAGFRSRANRLSVQGSCVILEGPADNLRADQVAARMVLNVPGQTYFYNNNPACEFTFFEGLTLRNGFVYGHLSSTQFPIVEGCGYVDHGFIAESGHIIPSASALHGATSNIRITIQGWAKNYSECQYVIDKIFLEGPAGTDWHLALGAKP
jgi:hypothetical protein